MNLGRSYEYMRTICAKGGYELVRFNEHGCPFFSDTKGHAYTVYRLNSALSYIYHTVEYVSEKEGYHHESAEIASAVTESYARILLEHMGD